MDLYDHEYLQVNIGCQIPIQKVIPSKKFEVANNDGRCQSKGYVTIDVDEHRYIGEVGNR